MILDDESYTFLLVAPHLRNADDSDIDLINEVYDYSPNMDIDSFVLLLHPTKTLPCGKTIQEPNIRLP